jgi:hypothetical protein
MMGIIVCRQMEGLTSIHEKEKIQLDGLVHIRLVIGQLQKGKPTLYHLRYPMFGVNTVDG